MKRTHRLVLIAGVSGSGKTTLLKYFKKHGKNVLDGSTDGIGIWVDTEGNPRGKPTKSEWAKREGFDWRWNTNALKRELMRYKHRELYAFSDAANLDEVMPLFEELYWLNADTELILSRLHKRARGKFSKIHGKTYGATKAQRDHVLRKLEADNKWAKKMGFRSVDAALTPRALFKIITS
jgi:dephospho-CoA kinase